MYDNIIFNFLKKNNIIPEVQIKYLYAHMRQNKLSFFDAVSVLSIMDEDAVLSVFQNISRIPIIELNLLNIDKEKIININIMALNLFIPVIANFDTSFDAQCLNINYSINNIQTKDNINTKKNNHKQVFENYINKDNYFFNSLNQVESCKSESADGYELIKRPVVQIAMCNPLDLKLIDLLSKLYHNYKIEFYLTTRSKLLKMLKIIESEQALETAKMIPNDNEPLKFLRTLVLYAINQNVSDIHIQPEEKSTYIRLRIDGVLEKYAIISKEFNDRLQNRLKLIANLDLMNNNKPQSGSNRMSINNNLIHLRISTHPNVYGENVVIRILNDAGRIKNLYELGFQVQDIKWLEQKIKSPYGIFLIIGPTGVGKTTTLYSLLNYLNNNQINIMTLEDPVEQRITGIKQLDIKEEGILSFSDGIRSILRQDPDVLFIGEIRDENTAKSALRASLTGRLVVSTLHAPTPIAAINRLKDLNIDIKEFIQHVVGIFSQRLVRMKKNHLPQESRIAHISLESCDHDFVKNDNDRNNHKNQNSNHIYETQHEAQNIKKYEGRFPIVEYLEITEEVKYKIFHNIMLSQNDLLKTFETYAKQAIKDKLTDKNEIERIFGEI